MNRYSNLCTWSTFLRVTGAIVRGSAIFAALFSLVIMFYAGLLIGLCLLFVASFYWVVGVFMSASGEACRALADIASNSFKE